MNFSYIDEETERVLAHDSAGVRQAAIEVEDDEFSIVTVATAPSALDSERFLTAVDDDELGDIARHFSGD